MQPISYARVNDVEAAVTLVGGDPGSAFLAGGTTKIDLMRLGVEHSDRLVDINALPLADVEELPDGTIRIGALARMNDVARTPIIKERFPAVSEALLLGASEQLRNMASMGGNLCQRTRCSYFRDGVSPCNKREPGTALVAFDAIVHAAGVSGERAIPIDDFYLPPGDTPEIEHPLAHGELITAIDLPSTPLAARSLYLKFRDRQSYEFALVSVAAALELDDGSIADARVALGGVGTKPWRASRAEQELRGAPPTEESFARAAAAELAEAQPRTYNAFKVALAERAIVRGLRQALNGFAA